MPATYTPFGFRFVGSLNGTHGGETRSYPLPNGASCPQLGKGSPVKHSAGVVTSVGTAGDAPILGVATGFQWVDGTTKQPQYRTWIPAGTSSAATLEGETRPVAQVVDMQDAIYMVQANASVTAGDVGLNFTVTAVGGDVDTVYGVSRYGLLATSRTSAITGSFKVVGLARIEGNSWADAFPIVLVKANRPVLADTSAF